MRVCFHLYFFRLFALTHCRFSPALWTVTSHLTCELTNFGSYCISKLDGICSQQHWSKAGGKFRLHACKTLLQKAPCLTGMCSGSEKTGLTRNRTFILYCNGKLLIIQMEWSLHKEPKMLMYLNSKHLSNFMKFPIDYGVCLAKGGLFQDIMLI